MILTVVLNPCIDKTVFIPANAPSASKIVFRHASAIQVIAGGKGNNVARVLKNFGYSVNALNLLGGGEGRAVASLLEAEGIEHTLVSIAGRTREIITVAETPGYNQLVLSGPSPHITSGERQALLVAYSALLPHCSLVVLSGSLPEGAVDHVYAEMIALARAAGRRTILDTRDAALSQGLTAGPFAVKPNLAEAEKVLGMKIEGAASQAAALDRITGLGISLAILSLGEQGVLARYEGQTYQVMAPKVEVVNPIGSGDSLVAGLAMGLVDNLDMEDTLRLGVAAGTVNASIWPAAGITREQVQRLLSQVHVLRRPAAESLTLPG